MIFGASVPSKIPTSFSETVILLSEAAVSASKKLVGLFILTHPPNSQDRFCALDALPLGPDVVLSCRSVNLSLERKARRYMCGGEER